MSTGVSPTHCFRARWLVPVCGPPIADGALLVRDGRILEVGPAPCLHADVFHDLGDVAILPGLINAHTHLELGAFAGRVRGPSLCDWLNNLVRLIHAEQSDAALVAAVRAGAEASLAAGVTCVGDISRTGLNLQPLSQSPIRKVCFLELISGARRPPNDAASLARVVQEAMRKADPPRLLIGVSPHAPYSVSEPDLRASVELAAKSDLPITMHWLETPDERDWLAGRPGELADFLKSRRSMLESPSLPESPFTLLERTGLLSRKPLLAHCNYVADHELDALARSQASVVWCPRTHAFFGHKPHPWQEMLHRGINVCIGTDSLASSPSLSMLDELRYVYHNSPRVSPDRLLELATIRPARALGLDESIGSLEPGKCADFIIVPCAPSAGSRPLKAIVAGDAPATGTWIDGLPVAGQRA